MGERKENRPTLYITGELMPDDGFEPDDIPSEGEVIEFQGTVVDNGFNRQIPGLEPGGMMWEARQEVGVARNETENVIEHRPFDTHIHPHQQDFPEVPRKEHEKTDEAVLGCPTLKTARKEKASRLKQVDVDKAGGDPEAQVEKPSLSFRLKRR